MKRIIAISALTAVACVGFGSVAHGQSVNATSTQTGTVAGKCAITGTAGTFSATANTTFNAVTFPSELTSTGGKFSTLCNTATATIEVAKTTTTVPTNQGAPTVTFDVTGSNTVYTGAILGTGFDATAAAGNAVHAFSDTASDLGVAVKVKAPAGKILEGNATANNYSVVLTATLTP